MQTTMLVVAWVQLPVRVATLKQLEPLWWVHKGASECSVLHPAATFLPLTLGAHELASVTSKQIQDSNYCKYVIGGTSSNVTSNYN